MLGLVSFMVALIGVASRGFSGFSWYLSLWGLAVGSLISMFHLQMNILSFESLSSYVSGDFMSYCLISLSFWISFLMLLASQQSVKINMNYEKSFCVFVMGLLLILILCFSVSGYIMFYFFFEASLIPILVLILGWGYQPERLQAGMYMMMYTIGASLPLLLVVMWCSESVECSNILLFCNFRKEIILWSFWSSWNFFTYLIFMAFLVKLPMFGVHLWLPKAHVEAPVAGSMILAAVLLKLGGYGIVRTYQYFSFHMSGSMLLVISFALMGGVITSINCYRQADLKSLIAYSSIGHMSLVMAGIFSDTVWGWFGALVLMISHGFCSSGLFALANLIYEKSGTRSLFLAKGFLLLAPVLSMWWFLFGAVNMACPPTINLLGEILIFPSVIMLSAFLLVSLGLMSFLAALYSMYLYASTQHGGGPKYVSCFFVYKPYVFSLLLLHWVPANLLILKSELVVM